MESTRHPLALLALLIFVLYCRSILNASFFSFSPPPSFLSSVDIDSWKSNSPSTTHHIDENETKNRSVARNRTVRCDFLFLLVGGGTYGKRNGGDAGERERERESDVTLSSVGVAVGLGRAESGCGFPHSSLPFFNFVLPPLGLCQRRRRIIPVEKNNPVGRLDFWPSNGWIDDPSFPCRPFESGLANSNPLSLSLPVCVKIFQIRFFERPIELVS